MKFLRDLFGFLRKRKKFWMIPILFLLLTLGVLAAVSTGSVLSPFVYTLF